VVGKNAGGRKRHKPEQLRQHIKKKKVGEGYGWGKKHDSGLRHPPNTARSIIIMCDSRGKTRICGLGGRARYPCRPGRGEKCTRNPEKTGSFFSKSREKGAVEGREPRGSLHARAHGKKFGETELGLLVVRSGETVVERNTCIYLKSCSRVEEVVPVM